MILRPHFDKTPFVMFPGSREISGNRSGGGDRGPEALGGLNLPLGFPQRAANGWPGKVVDMRNTTKLTIAAAGLLAVVSGGGAVAFAGTATPTPAPSGTATTPAPVNETPGTQTTPATPAPGEAEAKVKRDAAIKIAQDKVPGAKLVKAEFDGDDTPTSWEIEFLQGDVEHEFDIDATSGAILEQDQETETAAERAADAADDANDTDDVNDTDDTDADDQDDD